MPTFRVTKNKENPYVMLDKFSLNDSAISLKAKGLLAYLLSKPDNWIVKEHDLIAHCRDGRDSVRAAIRELEAAGYLTRGDRRRDSRGRMYEREYEVKERPSYLVDSILKRLSDLPTLENPSLDKSKAGRQFYAKMTADEADALAESLIFSTPADSVSDNRKIASLQRRAQRMREAATG